MRESTYSLSSPAMRISLIFHGVFILLLIGYTYYNQLFRKRLPPEPLDFTIVLPPAEMQMEEDVPQEKEQEAIVETPVKDAVQIEKSKPKPPEKPKPKPVEKPKPKPKPVEKPKPKPPEKKPFQKGKRIEAPPKPKVDFSKFKRVTTMESKEKPLSAAEIRKALQAGARIGTRNQIPETEMGRCVALVRNALYEAWEQPSVSEAGRQPAHLEIRLDLSGRIISYRIVQSSGNAFFDQSVLKAALNTEPIRGLSVEFLKQFERLTVEFKLQQ